MDRFSTLAIYHFSYQTYKCGLLNISYKDHVTGEDVHRKIHAAIGKYELLTLVKKQELGWFGHVSRSSCLAKAILQDTELGKKKKTYTEEELGRQY